MRVRLKDINRVTKRLADGTPRTYYYAWKGGPPLRGEPGTPAFIASFNESVASKKTPPRGRLLSVLQAFQDSEDFRDGIAPRTRADYIGKIKLIEKAFGDFPLSAIPTRGRAESSRNGVNDWPSLPDGRRTMRGSCWRGCSLGAWIAALCLPIPAHGVAGSIVARVRRAFGPLPTRPRFWNVLPRTCIWRCYSRCGLAKDKVISCGCRGRPMTGSISGFANPRAGNAS
jgi:hypothetical protein